MRFQKHYAIKKGEMNFTSFADVVLLLLVYFMLTSSFIMQPGIKIKLPVAVTSEKIEKKEILVSISENGIIFYKEAPITLYALESILSSEVKLGGDITLVVRGDEKTEHGNVVKVMDTARKVGIEKIAIATMPEMNR